MRTRFKVMGLLAVLVALLQEWIAFGMALVFFGILVFMPERKEV